jgi:hypothetical protein
MDNEMATEKSDNKSKGKGKTLVKLMFEEQKKEKQSFDITT